MFFPCDRHPFTNEPSSDFRGCLCFCYWCYMCMQNTKCLGKWGLISSQSTFPCLNRRHQRANFICYGSSVSGGRTCGHWIIMLSRAEVFWAWINIGLHYTYQSMIIQGQLSRILCSNFQSPFLHWIYTGMNFICQTLRLPLRAFYWQFFSITVQFGFVLVENIPFFHICCYLILHVIW